MTNLVGIIVGRLIGSSMTPRDRKVFFIGWFCGLVLGIVWTSAFTTNWWK